MRDVLTTLSSIIAGCGWIEYDTKSIYQSLVGVHPEFFIGGLGGQSSGSEAIYNFVLF
jgi:hypothetical protein